MKSILIQIGLSLAGALLFGVLGAITMINYGGNSCDMGEGCGCFCCDMFNSRGYEACGQFGLYTGALIGIALGIVIYRIPWKVLYRKIS